MRYEAEPVQDMLHKLGEIQEVIDSIESDQVTIQEKEEVLGSLGLIASNSEAQKMMAQLVDEIRRMNAHIVEKQALIPNAEM